MTPQERKIIGEARWEAMKYLMERMKNSIGQPSPEMKAEAEKVYEQELAKLKEKYGITA